MEALYRSDFWPFLVLILSVLVVVLMISRWRFHPFIALILAAIFVGFLSIDLPSPSSQHWMVAAVELPMVEFGIMAGKIAWVIALAAVIGTAMMESGAASQIVHWLLKNLGEKQAAVALIISGFILSIPVFLDTVFFLLIPLGITLARKTGRDYLLYVLAIGGGAVITHSIVPPTPGPLIMAETLQIDLGVVILAGLAVGLLPAACVYWIANWMNKKIDIPVRMPAEMPDSNQVLPSLFFSLLPIALPLLLIGSASVYQGMTGAVPGWVAFLGNKNIAMALGTAVALYLWAKAKNLDRTNLWLEIGKPLEIGGIIILITSAGGAYGAMIQHSGIANAIDSISGNFQLNYILMAWVISAVMKTAQGSGTVAMISAAAIMAALVGPEYALPYHPVYLLLAMGFGSVFISWMNDSAFWVVVRMSGFTEKEGLKTWTVLLAALSIIGLVQVLVLASLFPLVG
ncbi:GntP family permease [Lunatibacter salilacus]|uniref:GntP family permease n=1 Tax=Lunatibacter salilacus TaxID=2483804 RepID=UPI00131E4481|nr:SLC13 family permease [Lunatibacter salilacus]